MTSYSLPFATTPLITNVDAARTILRLLFPDSDRINGRIGRWRASWIQRLGLNRSDLTGEEREDREILLRTIDAGILFHANMASRYGSSAPDFHWETYDNLDERLRATGCTDQPSNLKQMHLPYHQEEHVVWVVDRLLEVCEEYDFRLRRCCVMLLSMGSHDLVQLQPGFRDDGIGLNEWLSAEEARLLMLQVGFDSGRDADLIDRIALNIHGTSFGKEGERVGALAPELVSRIQEKHPNWETSDLADEEIQDLLLTSDIDTSVVTDFSEYAKTTAWLCREMFVTRRGLTPLPAQLAFDFFTNSQRHFWEQQKFRSRCALELFQPRKDKVAPLVDELIDEMSREFESPEQDVLVDRHGKHVLDGELVVRAFLGKAQAIAGTGSESP